MGGRIERWQGGVAFVGVMLGVIPVIQKVVTGSTGSLWGVILPGGGEGASALVAAAAVVVAALVAVVVLERRRR